VYKFVDRHNRVYNNLDKAAVILDLQVVFFYAHLKYIRDTLKNAKSQMIQWSITYVEVSPYLFWQKFINHPI